MVDTLSAEIRSSLQQPEVRRKLLEQGATIHGGSAAETAAFHRAEMQKWKRAVEVSGARVE